MSLNGFPRHPGLCHVFSVSPPPTSLFLFFPPTRKRVSGFVLQLRHVCVYMSLSCTGVVCVYTRLSLRNRVQGARRGSLPWTRNIFPHPHSRSKPLSPGVSPRHSASSGYKEPPGTFLFTPGWAKGVCGSPVHGVGPSPGRRSASVPEFLGVQRRVPAFASTRCAPLPQAVYLCPQVLVSTRCVPPPYAELLCRVSADLRCLCVTSQTRTTHALGTPSSLLDRKSVV